MTEIKIKDRMQANSVAYLLEQFGDEDVTLAQIPGNPGVDVVGTDGRGRYLFNVGPTGTIRPLTPTCPDCVDGEVVLNPNWPSGTEPYSEKCSTCGGTGKI